MGRTKGAYVEEFPKGSRIRVASRAVLERFRQEWTFHHPLQEEQLHFASQPGVVVKVSFYHGGDELYELDGVPGIWHESCLRRADEAE
jgi:hypothetical protein